MFLQRHLVHTSFLPPAVIQRTLAKGFVLAMAALIRHSLRSAHWPRLNLPHACRMAPSLKACVTFAPGAALGCTTAAASGSLGAQPCCLFVQSSHRTRVVAAAGAAVQHKQRLDRTVADWVRREACTAPLTGPQRKYARADAEALERKATRPKAQPSTQQTAQLQLCAAPHAQARPLAR